LAGGKAEKKKKKKKEKVFIRIAGRGCFTENWLLEQQTKKSKKGKGVDPSNILKVR